ncbi:MAG: BCCT family transporter [Gammaproteobacteria bacterium]
MTVSLALVGFFGIWGLIAPAGMTSAATGAVSAVLSSVGWLYLLLTTSFLVLSAWLALGPYGSIKLGPDDSEPEFSTVSWLAMLFAGGMGAGLVFWGVAEPVSHFAFPPGTTEASSSESARLAMVLANLHWGFHAWSIYGVCALVIGYFMFRRSMPGLVSTPIRASLPHSKTTRVLGFTADIIGVFAVVFGLAGSLVLGVLQVRAGLSQVFNIPATDAVSLAILGVVVVAFMISASTGLGQGIKILSNVNMAIAISLMLFVLVAGPTAYLMESFVNSVGDYFSHLVAYSFRLLSYEGQMDWTSGWTLTYLIWWVAWGPFVGVFIARISRGRTIREFCMGVILVPTLFSILWFSVMGGAGIWDELEGGGGLAGLVAEDVSTALFALPAGVVLNMLAVLLVFIFLVTSADSGTFVVSMMSSEGSLEPSTRLKLVWGVAIAALTVSILVAGSVDVAKAMAVFGALPFTLIIVIQIVGFLRAIRQENPGGEA